MSLRAADARVLEAWTALLQQDRGAGPRGLAADPSGHGAASRGAWAMTWPHTSTATPSSGSSARRAGLEALPASVVELADLEVLDLDGNPLVRLPDGLDRLQALRALSAYGSALSSVPDAIGALTRLERLSLGQAPLTRVPEGIWGLTALRTLVIAETQLASVPERIGALAHLEMLDLGHNR